MASKRSNLDLDSSENKKAKVRFEGLIDILLSVVYNKPHEDEVAFCKKIVKVNADEFNYLSELPMVIWNGDKEFNLASALIYDGEPDCNEAAEVVLEEYGFQGNNLIDLTPVNSENAKAIVPEFVKPDGITEIQIVFIIGD